MEIFKYRKLFTRELLSFQLNITAEKFARLSVKLMAEDLSFNSRILIPSLTDVIRLYLNEKANN
jgi:hypothetical protein